MFEFSVSSSFHAQHAISILGVDEKTHNHNWKVTASVSGENLDRDGLLVDFIQLQSDLEDVIKTIRDTNLNTNPVLHGSNPTTEYVAKYIATELAKRVKSPARLSSITLTEAPNCIAIYRP